MSHSKTNQNDDVSLQAPYNRLTVLDGQPNMANSLAERLYFINHQKTRKSFLSNGRIGTPTISSSIYQK